MLWKHGQIDDGAVAWRYGRATLERFRTLTATVTDNRTDDIEQAEALDQVMVEAAMAAEKVDDDSEGRQQGLVQGREQKQNQGPKQGRGDGSEDAADGEAAS